MLKKVEEDEVEEFPFVKCPDPNDYADLRKIVKYIPHLKSLLTDRRHYLDLQDAHGLIIKSSTQENVHKAIKYGIWTTIASNMDLLRKLGKEVEGGKETFLFFSVSKSINFLGVARLKSAYMPGRFPYWVKNNKAHQNQFEGFFNIEWLAIKDISVKKFRNFSDIEGSSSVDHAKDCSLLSWETTRKMLELFLITRFKKSIFEDFDHYDKNEEENLRNPQNKPRPPQVYKMPSKPDKDGKAAMMQMPMHFNIPGMTMPMQSMPMPMPIPKSTPTDFTKNPIHHEN